MSNVSVVHDLAGQYLSFELKDTVYAMPLKSVYEINGITEITQVPNAPEFIEGVINLRDSVIPIMNLRIKLGMEAVEFTKETCFIVTETGGQELGLIVDRVHEVLDFGEDMIEVKPKMGNEETEGDVVVGMAKYEQRVYILIDASTILSGDEIIDIGSQTNGMKAA